MAHYLKVYCFGTAAVWLSLYGLMLAVGHEWNTGVPVIVLAVMFFERAIHALRSSNRST